MAAKETGALQAAKTKLEKQVDELTWKLQLEKSMRSQDMRLFFIFRLEETLEDVKFENQLLKPSVLNTPVKTAPGRFPTTSDKNQLNGAEFTRIQESESDTKSRGSHIDPRHEDVDALINCVTKNVGFSQGKPVAAFTIYKCLLHWKSFEAERTNLFDRLVQMIGSAIKDEDDNANLAYWLSNTSTLLFMLQQSLKSGGTPFPKSPSLVRWMTKVCKYFLDAVEKKQYGWFWVCPNGAKECHYRHALPPGYILKSQMKALLEEESKKMPVEEEIENERAKLKTATQMTPALFMEWKRKKIAERDAGLATSRTERAKNDRMSDSLCGLCNLSGRELFLSNASLFVDDAEAFEEYQREKEEEETEQKAKNKETDAGTSKGSGDAEQTSLSKTSIQIREPNNEGSSS
ncbi:unnamed protein product [Arabis nemorensis]|uniref:C3H1-type domain-containing protein n=1 Tax=Arabis nemorensis TaxID=586526 RepID=A0A565BFB6_9BRAS|nr:unnamed protein product [Arabis nemorensis]